jgi:ribonuclease P protein component
VVVFIDALKINYNKNMLAQSYRFHGYGSLKFLYNRGKVFRARSLSLRVAHNDRRTESRCTVIVTKKVFKAAPKRNRIRRRVYEIVRTNWHHIKPAHDILISVYDPGATDMAHGDLESNVVGVLKQAGVWQERPSDGKDA